MHYIAAKHGEVMVYRWVEPKAPDARKMTTREFADLVSSEKFVIIDVSGRDDLDWNHIGSLVEAKKAHRYKWGVHMNRFKVVVRPGKMREMVKLMQMEHVLPTYRSLNEALATFPRHRALQIEPEEETASVIEILLETRGFEVVTFSHPDQVFVRDDLGEFDIVLSAIRFDDRRDPDLARRLKVAFAAPVIVLDEDPTLMVDGATVVISHPPAPDQLIEAFGRALELHVREDFENILDQIPVPVAIVTEHGNLVYLNRKWRDAFQIVRGDLGRQGLESVFPRIGRNGSGLMKAISSAAHSQGVTYWDEGFGSKPEDRRAMRLRLAPVPIRKEANDVLITLDDVNPSLQAPQSTAGSFALAKENPETVSILLSLLEELDTTRVELSGANERLRQLDSLKNEFVSTVSHELRTPLTAIQGTLENLADGFLGSLDVRQQRAVELVLRNSKRLARMIDNLLDLSRIESGTLCLRGAVCDLRTPVRTAVEEIRSLAEKSGIAVTVDAPPFALEASVDTDRITQIVLNLLDNAIRFASTAVEVKLAVYGPDARITVEDDGPGIPEEYIERIFERFTFVKERADKAQSGIGLAIVRAIVEHHRGKVWAENVASKDHTGARIVVLLPLRPVGQGSDRSRVEAPALAAGTR